jgi:hypothetical protein
LARGILPPRGESAAGEPPALRARPAEGGRRMSLLPLAETILHKLVGAFAFESVRPYLLTSSATVRLLGHWSFPFAYELVPF